MTLIDTRALHCPCCGEMIELVVDLTAGSQQYVEDCPVCCQPMLLETVAEPEGGVQLIARAENE